MSSLITDGASADTVVLPEPTTLSRRTLFTAGATAAAVLGLGAHNAPAVHAAWKYKFSGICLTPSRCTSHHAFLSFSGLKHVLSYTP